MRVFIRQAIGVVIILGLGWTALYALNFGVMYFTARWSAEALAHEYQVEKERTAKRIEPLEYTARDCQESLWQIRATDDPQRQERALNICRYVGSWGDAQTQFELGRMYGEGVHGVAGDADEAMLWFGRAARQGHLAAQYVLILSLLGDGLVVAHDPDGPDSDRELLFMEAYAWFCTLEKGLDAPGALGLDDWREGAYADALPDVRKAFQQHAATQSTLFRFGSARMCKEYVQVFYPE